MPKGQRGEVYEVNGDQVAVILDSTEDNAKEGNKDENIKQDAKPSVYWFNSMSLLHDSMIMVILFSIAVNFSASLMLVMFVICSSFLNFENHSGYLHFC